MKSKSQGYDISMTISTKTHTIHKTNNGLISGMNKKLQYITKKKKNSIKIMVNRLQRSCH